MLFSKFDTLSVNTCYPKITLPTRFTNTCGTLIDNRYYKFTDNTIDTTSRILIKTFADHQPYFTFWNTIIQRKGHNKFTKINTHSQENINSFKNELIESDWMNKINKNPLADISRNYLIIHKVIEVTKNIHIPTQL